MSFHKLTARWERERQQRQVQASARKRALKTKGVALFKKYGVKKAVLFGSASSGASSSSSDIDLLVSPLEQQRYWEFKHQLQEATGYDIDLYTQADDPAVVTKVLERDEIIYHDAQR